MPTRPNVVLICVDQWRGDCLALDGHPVVQTPHLDDLAERGARFRRAYSATPSCVPARMALMTGLSQESHRRVGYIDGVPFDVPTTLAGEFTRGGYQTQAIGKLHVTPERNRIGFEHVILHDGYMDYSRVGTRDDAEIDDYLTWLRAQPGMPSDADYNDTGLNPNSVVARPWDKPERVHPTNWAVSEGIAFLKRRDPTVPFLLYLSFYYPHPPYDPPAWAFDMYLHEDLPDPVVGDWWEDYAGFRDDAALTASVARHSPRVLQRARAGYYGNITHLDNQINRFLAALRRFQLADNTYVAFTADHGEMLGDHHQYRKSVPYEGSARVPLILTGPADSGIERGLADDHVAELRDIMPTLLDCAGLPIPASVEGRSLLPLARGEQVPWRTDLHGEHMWFGQSMQWITDDRYKYVWLSAAGVEQLFDLAEDPSEERNLAGDPAHSGVLDRLRQRLVTALTGREEGYVEDGTLVPGRPPRRLLAAPHRPEGAPAGAEKPSMPRERSN